jgi:hypothetical protein
VSAPVDRSQRFTRGRPCPICGGWDGQPRGKGERCYGFLSIDGDWAHCSREERAGRIPISEKSDTYAHWLSGPCSCGVLHGATSVVAHEWRAPDTIHVYRDKTGKLLYEIGRWGSGKKKTFKARLPGQRKWSGIGKARRVLYRLPETLAAILDGRTIWITEGEKDCERVVTIGLDVTSNPFGAGQWRDEYSLDLRGAASVVILADNNKKGREHAQAVAASLKKAGTSKVCILELPGLGEGEDVSNWLDKGGTREELERLAAEAPDWTPGSPPAESLGDRPTIVVRNELVTVTDEAEAALLMSGSAQLFTRGNLIVRVIHPVKTKRTWLRRPAGAPVIGPVQDHHLRELMDRAAQWVKPVKGEMSPALPPMWVVRTLAARGNWAFPVLELVTESPTIRPDGTILDTPGYDELTGILYLPGAIEFGQIPEEPSQSDAMAALETLLEPFCDFPFVQPSDRSALAAHILAIVARPAIPGCCPLTAFRATTPGSGKGLLVDASTMVAYGRTATKMSPSHSDDETRKRILSIGIEGAPSVVIDNVVGLFGSESIAAALTTETFSDRLLGVSQMVTVPMRVVWALTGNNVSFRGDLPRRVVPCDLDPRMEHPEDRPESEFKYRDLLAHLRRARPALVVAALTLLRAFHCAGRPRHGKPRMGSFEGWDDLIRGSLIWAGAADPLGGRDRVREASDSELDSLRGLITSWRAVLGREPVTCSRALMEAESGTESSDELGQAIMAFTDSKLDRSVAKKLGQRLARYEGRIVDGSCFERDKGLTGGSARWRVVEVPSGSSGTSGTCSADRFSPEANTT